MSSHTSEPRSDSSAGHPAAHWWGLPAIIELSSVSLFANLLDVQEFGTRNRCGTSSQRGQIGIAGDAFPAVLGVLSITHHFLSPPSPDGEFTCVYALLTDF